MSAKAIGQVPPAQHVPPAQAAAIIGVPQSMIENPPPKKEKEECRTDAPEIEQRTTI